MVDIHTSNSSTMIIIEWKAIKQVDFLIVFSCFTYFANFFFLKAIWKGSLYSLVQYILVYKNYKLFLSYILRNCSRCCCCCRHSYLWMRFLLPTTFVSFVPSDLKTSPLFFLVYISLSVSPVCFFRGFFPYFYFHIYEIRSNFYTKLFFYIRLNYSQSKFNFVTSYYVSSLSVSQFLFKLGST